MKSDLPMEAVRWVDPDGNLIACTEKIKVLNENLVELQQVAQDAFEDGLLMGVDEAQLRRVFEGVIVTLRKVYGE